MIKFKGQEIMLFTKRAYTKHQDIHNQESFRKSGFLYSALQSPIQHSMDTCHVWYGYHQRKNTGSRLFTEVKPCWTGLISGWVTKSTASDIEISSLLNRNPLKHSKKPKIFFAIIQIMFEFINMLWSLIFIKSIRCILEVQQDR